MDTGYPQPSKKQRIAHTVAKKDSVTPDPYAPKVNGSVKASSTNINQNPASLSFNKEKLKREWRSGDDSRTCAMSHVEQRQHR